MRKAQLGSKTPDDANQRRTLLRREERRVRIKVIAIWNIWRGTNEPPAEFITEHKPPTTVPSEISFSIAADILPDDHAAETGLWQVGEKLGVVIYRFTVNHRR